jgi:hypothetical protein
MPAHPAAAIGNRSGDPRQQVRKTAVPVTAGARTVLPPPGMALCRASIRPRRPALLVVLVPVPGILLSRPVVPHPTW